MKLNITASMTFTLCIVIVNLLLSVSLQWFCITFFAVIKLERYVTFLKEYTTLLWYNNAPFYQNDHTKRYYFQVEVPTSSQKAKIVQFFIKTVFTYDYILTHI